MKKILSAALAICMAGTCIPAIPAAYAEDAQVYDSQEVQTYGTVSGYIAKAEFGESIKSSNMANVALAGQSSLTEQNGEKVCEIDKLNIKGENSWKNGRIYIDLDDDFFCGNTDGSQFAITVEYLDSGSTDFNIKYDGLDNTVYNYIASGYTEGAKISQTETVYATNSGKFKKHRFVISDANFANGLDGVKTIGGKYDLEIGYAAYKRAGSARSTYIKSVMVERIPAKNPVMVKIHSDVAGHTFNYNDVPSFKHTFKNYTNSAKTVEVRYTAKNKLGNIEWQQTENLSLSAGEEKVITKNPIINDYGLYSYYVEIPETEYSRETQFSYVNTSRDGLYNERFGYSTHFSETPEDVLQGEIDILKKSNSRSNRDEIVWAWNAKTTGNYHMSHAKIPLKYANANNLDTIWVLGYGNTNYTATEKDFPQTDEQINAFVAYVDHLIENYIGEDAKIELWNEPNGDYKNNEGKAAKYAYYINKVSDAVKAEHPNVRFGALSLCGIMSDTTHRVSEFTQAAIDAGAFDNIEAATMHPYENGAPEGKRLINGTMTLANMIKEQARSDIKLWHTEVGWNTAARQQLMITPRQQSAYHQRYFVLWDEIPEMEYYMVYDLMKDGNLRDETEDLFGIIDNYVAPESDVPMLATEAYVGVTNMNNILAGADKPTAVETGESGIYAYRYRNDKRGKDILTFWRGSDDTNKSISINLGVNSVTFVDSYGNETLLESEDGIYDVVPDFELSYLVGNFDNVEIGESALKVSSLNLAAESNSTVNLTVSGIEDAKSVEVKEKNFVTLSGNAKVSDKKAVMRVKVPQLDESKTSFNLLLKDGDAVRSVIRVYVDRYDSAGAGFEDDFSDYEYDIDETTNNRVDKWYIESGNNEAVSAYVRKDDCVDSADDVLEDALTLLPTKDNTSLSSKTLRGGRGIAESILPGETVTVEFDICAGDTSEFGIGFACGSGNPEDGTGRLFMRLCADSDADSTGISYSKNNLYYPNTQNPWAPRKSYFSGITFVRNEINHIKAEYKINEDVTTNSGDTLKITVSNSAGENQTATKKTYFRNPATNEDGSYVQGTPLTSIDGICFVKWDTDSTIYLDNFKMYRSELESDRQYYFKEDFTEFEYIYPRTNTDDGTNTWRIETGDNMNVKDYVTTESISDSKGNSMESALRLMPTVDATFDSSNKQMRGGRMLSAEAGPGETLTFEMDIYAEDDADFMFGLVPGSNTLAEDVCGYDLFRIQATSDDYKNTRMYYGSTQNAYAASGNYMKTSSNAESQFARNEVNHVKIEYTMNSKLYNTLGSITLSPTADTMKVTLTNSNGVQESKEISANYRKADAPAKLESIKGIAFNKFDTAANVYIDNIEVYKSDITRPSGEISAADVTEGNSSVTVTFTKQMNEESLAGIKITDEYNNELQTTGSLDGTGKVYTLTASFKAGSEYKVSVPTTVLDSDGIYLVSAVEKRFVAKILSTQLYLIRNGQEIKAEDIEKGDTVTVYAAAGSEQNGKIMYVLFAKYDGGKLVDTEIKNITAVNRASKAEFTADCGNEYKVFLWNIFTGEPYCNNL